MNEKVLVSFSSYNSPVFLEHLVESIERYDAGHPYDLLIIDNSSTDEKQLKLLERFAKKHRVETKPNHGRAQGGYDYAFKNNPDYAYYFFMHDDSAIITNGWLDAAVLTINAMDLIRFPDLKRGKVGYQGYEWGTKYKYLRTGFNQIFHYMDPIADILGIKIPEHYQHLNDDKILYSNEYLTKLYSSSEKIWNIEDWMTSENYDFEPNEIDLKWIKIHNWFKKNGLHNDADFAPMDRYGSDYNTFQTVCEFLNDINPMRHGFKTSLILKPEGYCQEELGWSKFWGNEAIVHYGDHVVFKRLSLLYKRPEEEIRQRFKDKTFLTICDNIIRREVNER